MFTYAVDGWRGYAVGALLVALATVARGAADLAEARVSYVATFFPAIMFATLIGGYKVGIFTTLLSSLASVYFFMPPAMSFALTDRETRFNLPLFVMCSALTVWIAHGYRVLVQSLRDADTQRQLLVDEMAHRGRNITAVVDSIVRNTLRPDTAKAEIVMGRLRTLLTTEQLFAERTEAGEHLTAILRASLAPFGSERILLRGADIIVEPRSASLGPHLS